MTTPEPDDLRPINSRTKVPKNTPLVDDLADVLSHIVVGWEPLIGQDLALHPAVVRVMARYRAWKANPDPLVVEALHVIELRNDRDYSGGQELAEMVLERFGVKG